MSDTTLAVQRQPSGMELLAELSRRTNDPQAAIEIAKQIVDLEIKMKEIQEGRERFEWEKGERNSKVAFAEAFKNFKENAPKILKTKHVNFPSKDSTKPNTDYWHVELDKACDLLIPALLKVDITHRWKSTDLPGGMTRVTCFLRHRGGYEEEGASLAGPSDQSGGKNPIQGVGSSVIYLQRYTFLATCGIVAAGKDNDGYDDSLPVEVTRAILDMKEAEPSSKVMTIWAFAIDVAKKQTPVHYRAMTEATEARDARLKELKGAK